MEIPLNSTTIAPVRANVLSVSPISSDHAELDRILKGGTSLLPAGLLWNVSQARTLALARIAITRVAYAAVLCECDLQPGSWQDLLESIQGLADPPLLIVTSRQADEHLWAEALNVGAHDVLAKPFYAAEVWRVVNLACLRWHRDQQQRVMNLESPQLIRDHCARNRSMLTAAAS